MGVVWVDMDSVLILIWWYVFRVPTAGFCGFRRLDSCFVGGFCGLFFCADERCGFDVVGVVVIVWFVLPLVVGSSRILVC